MFNVNKNEIRPSHASTVNHWAHALFADSASWELWEKYERAAHYLTSHADGMHRKENYRCIITNPWCEMCPRVSPESTFAGVKLYYLLNI